MKELGYDEVVVDDWGNVVGKIQGEQDRAAIIFDGHINVVPVTDASAWHYDSYAAEIPNDKIYGRGASNMKGALSAIICGIGSLVPLKKQLGPQSMSQAQYVRSLSKGLPLARCLTVFQLIMWLSGNPLSAI